MAEQLRFGRTWVYHNRRVDYQTEAQIKEDVRHTARVAEEWKTVCESSRDKEPLVILQRVEPGEWWLLCARREGVRATDHRPVIAVYLAELMQTPKVETLWGWMQAFARDCKDGLVPTVIGSFPEADPELENEEQISRAALALTLLYNWTLPPGQLTYLSDEWIALEIVPWILSCQKIPEKMPVSKGLLVTEAKLANSPRIIETCSNRPIDELVELKLPELMRCPEGEVQRMRLVKKALGFPHVTLEEQPLAVPTLRWMLKQPYLRRDAFERVEETQVGDFLSLVIHAQGEELQLLKPKLNPRRDRQQVVRLLSQQEPDAIPHRFEQYLELFPAEKSPPTELLSSDEQKAWAYLRGESVSRKEPGSFATIFRLIQGRKLEHGFVLRRVAATVGSGVTEAVPLFRDLLRQEGLPSELIAALVDQQPLATPLELPPALNADDQWLRGIKASAFLALTVGEAAETWWLSGLDYFVEKGKLTLKELLRAGCQRVSLPLLQRARVPESVLALVDPQRPQVEISESLSWPEEVHVLLNRLAAHNRLWSRFRSPVSLAHLQALINRLPTDNLRLPLSETVSQLSDGKPTDASRLSSFAHLLESSVARHQLPHLLSLEPFPQALLDTLLDCWKGEDAKVAWLRGRCFTGRLSAMPEWSVADMIDFFPLLEPVNDILLVVLNRDTMEDREDELLARLVNHFQRRQPIAVGYHPDWARRRPGWVQALAPILGWSLSSESSP